MSINKKRRGRPCLKIDKGTKELQQKRGILLGTNPGVDHGLAESLLGLFYGRQLISRPLYEAGVFFGELGYRYEPCLGHKFRRNSSSLSPKQIENQGTSPFQWSDEHHEKLTIAWRKALKALKKSGDGPFKIVLEVVFHDQDLYTTPFTRSMNACAPPLRKGLKSLEDYFKGGSQDRRGKRCDRGIPGRSTRFLPPLNEHQSCSLP